MPGGQRSRWRAPGIATIVAGSLALGCAAAAQARTVPVRNADSLAAAVATASGGDVIELAAGSYAPGLAISSRSFSPPLTIEGPSSAVLPALSIRDSSGLELRGIGISPIVGSTAAAFASIRDSSSITFDGVVFDGRSESLGVSLVADSSTHDLTIENSEFTNCGGNVVAGSYIGGDCLWPQGTDVLVLDNSFHDCQDCDFIRGYASGVTIEGNDFERAERGSCVGGPASCNHNDHIQIMGGGPWTIVGNHFGDRGDGAASVYVRTARNSIYRIHDVTIENNLFSGAAGLYAVELGAEPGLSSGYPQRVLVANNTMLSGTAGAVRLIGGWLVVPASERPVVANNVEAVSDALSCASATWVSNLVERGPACGSGDGVGPANLDDAGRPTVSSTRVVNLADPALSPPTDALGVGRIGRPDRGAYEWTGGALDHTPPTPPAGLGATALGQTQVGLSWRPASDADGIAWYGVAVDGTALETVGGTNATLAHLSCGTTYAVAVTAVDPAGNVSAPATVSARTDACPDTTPPTVQIQRAQLQSGSPLRLTVVAAVGDDTGVPRVVISLHGQAQKAIWLAPSEQHAVVTFVLGADKVGSSVSTVTVTAYDGHGHSTSATAAVTG
jgi:hypothetical protein